jgi:hypothetical protein
MKKEIFKFFSFMLFVVFSYCSGTTGASFLKIGVGAKAAGISEAFTAVADDVTAIYWNPAGVSKLSQKEIFVMHNKWIANTNHEFLGYVHPFHAFGLGIGCIFLHMEPIPFTTTETAWLSNENFSAYSYAILLNFSQKRNNYFFWGTNLKIIREKIYNYYSSLAYAIDVGVLYKFKKVGQDLGLSILQKINLDLGLSILNIGTPIKFIDEADVLPLQVRLGIACYFKEKVMFALDISQYIDNVPEFHFGIQYTPLSWIFLRAGYKYKLNGNDIEGTGFSVGIGFSWKMFSLDYAFVPFGVLGESHKISLSFGF